MRPKWTVTFIDFSLFYSLSLYGHVTHVVDVWLTHHH